MQVNVTGSSGLSREEFGAVVLLWYCLVFPHSAPNTLPHTHAHVGVGRCVYVCTHVI